MNLFTYLRSLLPDHRMYLLALVCFYVQLEKKAEFTDIELEFLIRGKNFYLTLLLNNKERRNEIMKHSLL